MGFDLKAEHTEFGDDDDEVDLAFNRTPNFGEMERMQDHPLFAIGVFRESLVDQSFAGHRIGSD
jgi:hypothetical protein